jgi:hypothetical protein
VADAFEDGGGCGVIRDANGDDAMGIEDARDGPELFDDLACAGFAEIDEQADWAGGEAFEDSSVDGAGEGDDAEDGLAGWRVPSVGGIRDCARRGGGGWRRSRAPEAVDGPLAGRVCGDAINGLGGEDDKRIGGELRGRPLE